MGRSWHTHKSRIPSPTRCSMIWRRSSARCSRTTGSGRCQTPLTKGPWLAGSRSAAQRARTTGKSCFPTGVRDLPWGSGPIVVADDTRSGHSLSRHPDAVPATSRSDGSGAVRLQAVSRTPRPEREDLRGHAVCGHPRSSGFRRQETSASRAPIRAGRFSRGTSAARRRSTTGTSSTSQGFAGSETRRRTSTTTAPIRSKRSSTTTSRSSSSSRRGAAHHPRPSPRQMASRIQPQRRRNAPRCSRISESCDTTAGLSAVTN